LLPIPALRVPFGLVAALFAPGYALTAALFPGRTDLDGPARAALSFGLSVATLPVLALVLNVLPWGIRLWPIVLTLSLWLLLLSGIALWRRRGAASGAAYVPPTIQPMDWWHSLSQRARASYAVGGLVLVLIGTAAGTGFTMMSSDPSTRTTEFYVLGPNGLVENYPREVTPGQEMQVKVGIRNDEGAPARYRVEVRTQGQLLSQTEPITLESGGTWESPLRYMLTQVGDDQPIDILLFRNDDPKPLRQLGLSVNVRTGR
jgi:uncharacterized membrane protein